MERITLTRTGDSHSTPPSLRIIIRVKTRPLRMALLTGALLLWGYGAVTVGWPILDQAMESASERAALSAPQEVALLAFLGTGLALAGRFAWILIGRETFVINPLALRVRRSIGPIAVRRTYRFADLQNARIVPRPGTAGLPPWRQMCLETDRETVLLRHRERYIRLARDLDKAEGAYLLTAIRLWMQERGERSP